MTSARRAGVRTRTRRSIGAGLALVLATAVLPFLGGSLSAAGTASGYPSAPPAQICGDTALLAGPASPPPGAVRVEPGTNLNTVTMQHTARTTFWLAPGTHTLGNDPLAQVVPKNGNVYVGAPGAILDGGRVNRFAFTQQAADVQIRHLTIQRFGAEGGNVHQGVVNHDAGRGWVIEYNTIKENAGAGVMTGNDNIVRYNCISDNGQYGISAYRPGGVSNITVDHNEIARNNVDDWERRVADCGCSGATKFWEVHGAAVTDNYVHHNRGSGIWADTNNVGFRIEGNWIEANDDEGIFYEISYNARIAGNVLKRNAITKGKVWAARGDYFPVGAIYISESGGDTRVNSGVYSTFEISNNLLEDNWGGVVLWENADRFCNSPANSSTGYCTKGGKATLSTCVSGTINSAPYYGDCRWKTQNVSVHHNDQRFSRANVGCTTTGCGQQAVFSNYGTVPSWSPYKARAIQDAITWNQNNRFFDNTYTGDWRFLPWEPGNWKAFEVWQSTFGQDTGSTFNGSTGTTTTTAPATTTTTTTGPGSTLVNRLDADSAGLEGSVGHWVPWFSATTARSTDAAHSGSASLRVDVTRQHGWGVTQGNWPGFRAGPGSKTLAFWSRTSQVANLGVNMSVNWRDEAGNTLRTDTVGIPSLTGAWQQATINVTAPPGTTAGAVDFSHTLGVPGNFLFIDDVLVAEGSSMATTGGAAPNLVDADSSGFEGSTGAWASWFSANVASSAARANRGARSLEVSVTAPHGWGVHQVNWPGFPAAGGPKTVSFWAAAGSGSGLGVTMTLRWRDAAGNELGSASLSATSLGGTWKQATASVVAPAGTQRMTLELTDRTAPAGSILYVDDVVVSNGSLAGVNALDPDTASLEKSAGKWVPWFSANPSTSDFTAQSGGRSLRVEITAAFGWGITHSNWPGFVTTAGAKTIGFSARAGTGAGLEATMFVHWRDTKGSLLRTDTVQAGTLTGSWSAVSVDVTPPPGTARVGVDVTGGTGTAGDVLYLDDFLVVDR